MAQLDTKLAQFAAATTAATINTSRKLIRNFQYYRSVKPISDLITRDELLLICHNIRMDLFGITNLLNDQQMNSSPFLVSLAGRINDSLEELHRKLLFFDAEHIEAIIPEIDNQRAFWSDYTESSFYDGSLLFALEHSQAVSIRFIEQNIQRFPISAEV